MKLATPERPSFSRYAKLCDQNFYHKTHPVQYSPHETIVNRSVQERKTSTYAFTSVSRQKRGNFRFPNRLPIGQFTQHPNIFYGRVRNPTWSFAKSQRYDKVPIVEYELCEKHPDFKQDKQLKMRASTTSMQQLMEEKVRSNRTTSYFSIKDKNGSIISRETKASKNYSIVEPQQTSQIGFYVKSKIKRPRYLSKQDLNKLQSEKDEEQYKKRIRPCPHGYVEFFKRRARNPNKNSKGFQTILYSNKDQKQFNNFQATKTSPPFGHIKMQKHLNRPDYTPDRLGPNTQPYSIDLKKINSNHINLNFEGVRDKIVTRYDRADTEPNTRLDYEIKDEELPGMVEMDRMISRNKQLFPIVDPAIKKAGDTQMKQQLKKCISFYEINEAYRPKNVENYTKMVNQNL